MKKISQDILGKRQDVAGSSFSLLCKSGSHELAHIFALGMSKKKPLKRLKSRFYN